VAPYDINLVLPGGQRFFATIERGEQTTVPIVPDSAIVRATDQRGISSEATLAATQQLWLLDTVRGKARRWDANVMTVTVEATGFAHVGARNLGVRPTDEHLFIVDQMRTSVVEYDANGAFVREIPVPGAYRPQDIAFAPDGTGYVIDRGGKAGAVFRLDPVTSAFVGAASVPLPGGITYPMYGNTITQIVYLQPNDILAARINAFTIALVDPATLSVTGYRFAYDPLVAPAWDIDAAADELLSAAEPGSWGSQRAFIAGPASHSLATLRAETYATLFTWAVPSVAPLMADIRYDGTGAVWGLQSQTYPYGASPRGTVVAMYLRTCEHTKLAEHTADCRLVGTYAMPPANRVELVP